jgi:glycosyltransferase involved in cell wall biosynthesis
VNTRSLTLSVLVPCYNEGSTIERTLDAVGALADELYLQAVRTEVIVVDDASTDGTYEMLVDYASRNPEREIKAARHSINRGKGAAIRTARGLTTGEWIIIQDADLEYSPRDIPRVLRPIMSGHADAVIGSRFLGSGEHRVLYFWHRVANAGLTLLSNMLTDLNLTDVGVGYKAFTREVFMRMHLTQNRFGIDPEIVARLAQMQARVFEVPISYYGRTYAQGKKITWRDGVAAVFHIVRARLTWHRQPLLGARGCTLAPEVSFETMETADLRD